MLVCSFLVVTLALGGAGSDYPLIELAVELAGLAVLFSVVAGFLPLATDRWSGSALFLAILIALLMAVQLIPLPANLQQELPGRESYHSLLSLVGGGDSVRPISLDPEATWRALLEYLTGIAAFVGVLSLAAQQRSRVVLVIVGFAMASVLIGALQAVNFQPLTFFQSTQNGLPAGLFTNRNHQATFLDVAIVLAASLGRQVDDRRSRNQAIALAVITLLAAGVIATRSRTGIALLCVSLPTAILLLSPGKSKRMVIAAAATLAVVVAAALWFTSAGQLALDRFGGLDDARFSIWTDTKLAISQFWPVGSGFGTFPNVFDAFESLASVGPNFVNHAHDEYLELLLEGGIVALLLLVAGIAFLIAAGVHRVRSSRSREGRSFAIAGMAGIAVFLLHSIVDYPLRMLSLMAVFGCLAALLFRPGTSVPNRAAPRSLALQLSRIVLAAAATLGLAYEAISLHLTDYAVQSGDMALAQMLAPRSADASTFLAQRYLADSDIPAAVSAASQALRISPIHSPAIAVLGVSQSAFGHPVVAAKLMDIAAAAGWRDPLAQGWLLGTAMKIGNVDVAAERADALLRQKVLEPEVFAALRQLLETDAGRRAVSDRLGDDPAWGKPFLRQVSKLTDRQLSDQMELIAQMRRSHVALDDGEWTPLVRELVSRRRFVEAHELWSLMRGVSASRPKLFDGSFDWLGKHWPASGIPFEWKPIDAPDADVTIDARGPSRNPALHVAAQSGAAGPVLEQLVVLGPGPHTLSADLSGADASATRFDLQCAGGPHLEVRGLSGTAPGKMVLRFSVPDDCAAQWFRVILTGEGVQGDLWLDNVAIDQPLPGSAPSSRTGA